MIPALIGAAATIGSSILTNEANKRNADYAFNREQAYNNWLMQNETQMRVRDLRAAGLNPAFMNGAQMGSSAGSPSYDTPHMLSPLDLSSAMMFGKVASDTRLTNAQAKAQELLNADKEAYNKEIGKSTSVSYTDSNNVPINDLDKWTSEHPNEIPNQLVITQFGKDGASGKFDASQVMKRWDKEVSDIDVGKLHNQLETMVTKGQISNPRVIQALQNMPYWTYKDLIQKVNNAVVSRENMKKQGKILDITAVTAKLEQDMARDSNINQYIEKMFNGNFEIKDLCKVLVMAFLGCVSNFGGNLFKGSPQKTTTINIGTQQ